jgi:hypothetical protein
MDDLTAATVPILHVNDINLSVEERVLAWY